MKRGFLLFAALLLLAGSTVALPSYTGLRGLNRTVDAKPIGAGEFSLALFSFLGMSNDARDAQLSGGTVEVTDTEYDGTWHITGGFGLTDKLEVAGRVTYVWNCLSRESVEGRENLIGGENENDDGFSEAHLFFKYGTSLDENETIWMGVMPWVGTSIYDGGDNPYVTNYNQYDGIWYPEQPMFQMRRPMIRTTFSAGADILASMELSPIVVHANVGYHYFKQNFQFTDHRYGTADTVEVDMDVDDPAIHLAVGLEYPMKSLTLFAECEWRYFMDRDFEDGNGEVYNDMFFIQPGVRIPVTSGLACDVVAGFSIDNFDPEWSDLGHHAYQAGGDPTNEDRSKYAPFPEGYYPNWGVGVNLMYSSDLVDGPGSAMMSGTVTDAVTGQFLEASIAFPGTAVEPAMSDGETGFYSVEVPEGQLQIAVNADGYIEKTASAAVVDGADLTMNFTLEPQPATVSGYITDMETGAPVAGTVEMDNGPSVQAGSDGMYSIDVPAGQVELTASGNGYLPVSKSVDVMAGEQVSLDFQLESCAIEEGEVLSFDNIYFDVASSTIKPESYPVLDEVVEILDANPNATIRIAGHTDSDGSQSYNQTLSEERAASVMNYLVQHGIAASRLSTVGYGESQPVVPNTSAQNKAMNRRIEFEVLSNP